MTMMKMMVALGHPEFSVWALDFEQVSGAWSRGVATVTF